MIVAMIVRSSIVLVLALMVPLAIYAQGVRAKKELGQIKKIYVEDDPYETPNEKAAKPLLQAELTKLGFIVAATKDDADAVLSGIPKIDITIHPKLDSPPDRAIYRYKLLSRDNKVLWKHSVTFVAKDGWLKNNTVGSQRIVERLVKDILKAKEHRDK